MHGASGDRERSFTADMIALFIEAHIVVIDRLELGVDVELLHWMNFRYSWEPTDEVSFGFFTLRAKAVVHRSQHVLLAAGAGLLLPTSSSKLWKSTNLIGLDPGLYLMLRPLDWLSVNISFPVVLQIIPQGDETTEDPDEGRDRTDVWLAPSVGVAAMPLSWLGAFADAQVHAWMDPRKNIEYDYPMFIQLSITAGIRLRPFDWLLAEVAVVVPAYGQRSGDGGAINGHIEYYPGWDVGLATRIAITP